MRLLPVIFLLTVNSVLLSATTGELEMESRQEESGTCPSDINSNVIDLGDYRTAKGQEAMASAILGMLQSWETVPPGMKKIIQDKSVSLVWENKVSRDDSLAFYDVDEKKIWLDVVYLSGLANEIQDRVAREDLSFYLALYLLPTFSHEFQHAVNDFNGVDFDVRENEFSAYTTQLIVIAEAMARYPEIYNFYARDSFSDDYLELEFLGEFLIKGPDAIWERIDDLYEDLPYLEEELEANLILQIFRRHTVESDADPKYKKALVKIEQEDDVIYNYYDNEIDRAQSAWQELSRLRDECGESVVTPPSNIADQVMSE